MNRLTTVVLRSLQTLSIIAILIGLIAQPAYAGKTNILFSGNPRYQNQQHLIGDKGFVSDYKFGDTKNIPYEGRIVGGPFAREFDQYDEGIRDDATYLVIIKGSGSAIIGATDFKMSGDNHFGFYREEVELSAEGTAFTFYWPGLVKEGDSYNGYGFEIIVLQGDGQRAVVKNIQLILVGQGDLTK